MSTTRLPPTKDPSVTELAVEAELQQLLSDEHAGQTAPPDAPAAAPEREKVPTPV